MSCSPAAKFLPTRGNQDLHGIPFLLVGHRCTDIEYIYIYIYIYLYMYIRVLPSVFFVV